jgi:hypothetical protein
MDEAGKAMRQSTSTRVTMSDDVLASPDPFPPIEHSSGQASSGNRLDNQFALLDQSAIRADRQRELMAVASAASYFEADKTETPAWLTAKMTRLHNKIAETMLSNTGHAELDNSVKEQTARLSQLARTTAENTAPPEIKHAANSAAQQDEPRRGEPTSSRFADALRKRYNELQRKRDGETLGPLPPRLNPDGPIKMRLTSKPPTRFGDLTDDAKVVLNTRLGIGSEMRWLELGPLPCPLCRPPDHFLHHCVKVWAATDAGQKWLGTSKAAEFRARIGSAGMFTLREFMNCFEPEFMHCDEEAQDARAHATMYVCEYCDIEFEEQSDATKLLLFVDMYRGKDMQSVLSDTMESLSSLLERCYPTNPVFEHE